MTDWFGLAVSICHPEVAMERELVSAVERKRERPAAEWCCSTCPVCGEVTVINYYWQGGKGYVGYEECWASLGASPACDWRRVR